MDTNSQNTEYEPNPAETEPSPSSANISWSLCTFCLGSGIQSTAVLLPCLHSACSTACIDAYYDGVPGDICICPACTTIFNMKLNIRPNPLLQTMAKAAPSSRKYIVCTLHRNDQVGVCLMCMTYTCIICSPKDSGSAHLGHHVQSLDDYHRDFRAKDGPKAMTWLRGFFLKHPDQGAQDLSQVELQAQHDFTEIFKRIREMPETDRQNLYRKILKRLLEKGDYNMQL